jgi:hypothetical protein
MRDTPCLTAAAYTSRELKHTVPLTQEAAVNGRADSVADARKDPREHALLPCHDGIKK